MSTFSVVFQPVRLLPTQLFQAKSRQKASFSVNNALKSGAKVRKIFVSSIIKNVKN
jgi:hypothetical protein